MAFNKLPSIQTDDLPSQSVLDFNYTNLDFQTQTFVQQRTSEIKKLMRHTTEEIIEIGQKLIDVKAQLKHGNFRNWLRAEFDWSVKTASRFMQVTENFKCANLTHLSIATSALYLLASPSTPQKARTEAIKRAQQGESINYTKAKTIVSQHKKPTKYLPESPLTFDVHTELVHSSSTQSFKPPANNISTLPNVFIHLTPQEVETAFLPTQDFLPPSMFNHISAVSTSETTQEPQSDDAILITASIVNQTTTIPTSEIEIGIKQLTPEQLASVIVNSAKDGLSNHHLEAIITAAKQALTMRNDLLQR